MTPPCDFITFFRWLLPLYERDRKNPGGSGGPGEADNLFGWALPLGPEIQGQGKEPKSRGSGHEVGYYLVAPSANGSRNLTELGSMGCGAYVGVAI